MEGVRSGRLGSLSLGRIQPDAGDQLARTPLRDLGTGEKKDSDSRIPTS